MFGPESGANGWAGLPFLYDRVRTAQHKRTADFLSIWEGERCKMVEMSCELHDKYAANTQFITHLMGRILGKQVMGEGADGGLQRGGWARACARSGGWVGGGI